MIPATELRLSFCCDAPFNFLLSMLLSQTYLGFQNFNFEIFPVYFANLFISAVICTASSLVGTRISACIGPLRFIFANIGSAKAAVFPVPVWACPITSIPFSISGIASCCIGKGSSYPLSFSALVVSTSIPNS